MMSDKKIIETFVKSNVPILTKKTKKQAEIDFNKLLKKNIISLDSIDRTGSYTSNLYFERERLHAKFGNKPTIYKLMKNTHHKK